MAFLALSGVDDGVTSTQISCKILSLSSTIFSTSTLFSTMRLTAFHQHFKTATTDEAMWYMSECSSGPLGLFSVAMLFSVPFTTFMWSMLTFIAAVLVFSFQHWTLNAGIPLIATTVVPVAGILSWMFWFFASWSRTRSGVKHEWAADHAPVPPPKETTVASNS
ncbi:hypothetical protein AURDEDRAFT_184803 [Auricularia subglabra TFB-10046 SS5]|nr:hypothetical protein AURDEDRAFT_184803 [Auricularia subglabra TFB-10046 SS5]